MSVWRTMVVAIAFPAVLALSFGVQGRDESPSDALIGYTELRTNLAGGRQANVTTMRAAVVKADGTGRRLLAEQLTRDPNTWTQFGGWAPDGRTAIIGRGWESPQNGKWEEEQRTF